MPSIPIANLKTHPRNHIFKASEETIRLLSLDIAERGLQEPILVNQDGVIFSGHKRLEACKRLGWKSILAEVRDIPVSDIRTLILANTARQHVGYATRMRIYEAYAPDLLKATRVSKERLDRVSREITISPHTITKDLQKFRGEAREITVSELKEVWQKKDPSLKVSVVDTGRGFIIQVVAKNFKTESGPGEIKEVIMDSYRRASSSLYERSSREYRAIGDKIRALRKGLGMTQTTMAKALEISQSYLAECEAGQYKSAEDILHRIRVVMEAEGAA